MTNKTFQPKQALSITSTLPITKGEQSRCRILEAARKLFYQKGFFATSINDVAEEAGVLKGNLSYYFPSKSELLESTTAVRTREIREQMDAWTNSSNSLYESLECFLLMYENSADEIANYGCDIGTLTDELGKGEGELQDQPRQMFDLVQAWLTTRFATRFANKVAKEYAEHLFTMVQGAAVLTHAYRDPDILLRRGKMIRVWLKEICQ